jgi:hypothetical protein
LNEGKVAPPIELSENHTSENRSGRLYDIFNGVHRYRAAVNAGRTTISAVIVAADYEGDDSIHWFSYKEAMERFGNPVWDRYPNLPGYYEFDELIGRGLSKEEYDSLSLVDLQTAIANSMAGTCIFDVDNDLRFTPEFWKLSLDELKQQLEENRAIVLCMPGPEWRNVFPVFKRGPRKGLPNYKKEPTTYEDRWYCVEFRDDLEARED